MEILSVDTIQTLKKVGSKEGMQAACIKDSVTFSMEVQKRGAWIEKLKEMPDIRPEKIEMALKQAPIPSAELAAHLMHSLF